MLTAPEACARLILLRHPELAESYRTTALGQNDGELSRRGRAHVIEVIRLLADVDVDQAFSSPARHCQQTAAAIAKDRGIVAATEDRLHEQNLGEWTGRDWGALNEEHAALVREFFQDYGLVAPPGGETLTEAVDRALGWWNDVVSSAEGSSVLVVGAAPLLSGLAARLLGLSLRRAPALTLPPAAIGILDVYGDGAVVRTWHPLCLSREMP